MKVTIEYNNNLSEDEIIIQANPRAQDLSAITTIIEQRYSTNIFRGKKMRKFTLLDNKILFAFELKTKCYISILRQKNIV